jgi:hypothetical protein
MSATRWFLESDSIPNVQVNPTWSGRIEHDRVNDGVFFRAKLSQELSFRGTDYTNIFEAPDCELITVIMEELCGESWTERFRGEFTTFDVKFDNDKCVCSVVPRVTDDYVCFLQNYEADNVVSGAGDVVEVLPFGGDYKAGYECCLVTVDASYEDDGMPLCPVPDDWCFDKNWFQSSDGVDAIWMSCFHRITAEGTPTIPPDYGDGWTLLTGSTWWRCPTAEDVEFSPFDNGRWLNDILEFLATSTGCGLTVRSHFFGLNDTHAAPPSNDAYTFADAYCQFLQVHQKSDIKRPEATNPAQSYVWKMSFSKLLQDIENMFNVFWKIDGSDLILEHITYFEGTEWLDLSERDIVKVFEKKEGGAPNKERYYYTDAEATFTADFAAQPIIYGDCGTGTNDVKLNYFSNDVYYIKLTDNQTEIADSGFCMVSTELIGTDYVIKEYNTSMGWPALHENLFKQRRYFESGTMNGMPETFTLLRKSRKLETLSVEHCCNDTWNPEGYITTQIGEATIERVTKDYFKDRAIIEANI